MSTKSEGEGEELMQEVLNTEEATQVSLYGDSYADWVIPCELKPLSSFYRGIKKLHLLLSNLLE